MPRMEALGSEITRLPSLEKWFELHENLGPVSQCWLDGQLVEPFQP